MNRFAVCENIESSERIMQRRVSAKDVALLAGVSRAAVSRTFGGGQVSQKVRLRVQEAAKELGYRPNAIARSLIGGRTDLVAVITAGRDSIHNSLLIEQLIVAIARRGKRAMVVPAAGEEAIDGSILDVSDYQVDAIVVIGGTVSPNIIERLKAFGVPLFLYERLVEDKGLECIMGNNVLGSKMAASYLIRNGCRKLAYITKPLDTFSNQARREGLVAALADAGLELFAEAKGEQGYQGGFRAAMELFSAREIPDSLICFNDEMAFGALQAAATMNIDVPGELAIIGYDDIPMANWPVFNLTTIHNAIKQPVNIIVERIEKRLEHGDMAYENHVIEPELIVRGTTR
ncbi:MAG: LacI family DNA-binding transcriptional regulator [Rhizobiaceae bacterium]